MGNAKLQLLATALCVLLLSAGANAAVESENFDTAAGAAAHGWSAVTTTNAILNHSNTSFTGGALGEGGGASRRSVDTGYYADTTLGTQHFGTDTLTASADFVARNNAGFNGINLIGFFDKTKISGGQANWVGMLLTDNNASTYRIGSLIIHDPAGSVSGEDNFDSGPLSVLNFDTVYTLTLTTSGKDLTTTVKQGATTVYNNTVTSTSLNSGVDNFDVNAFGLISGGSSSGGANFWESYLDDATYSTAVPEPASISLLGGAMLLGLARRRR
jgi:hypothetical protein